MAVETSSLNLVKKVLEKLGSVALQEVRLACETKNNLKRREKTLSAVKALLQDAKEQSHTNCQLTDWLKMLEDVFYDADDLLDELEYEALWRQVLNYVIKNQRYAKPCLARKV